MSNQADERGSLETDILAEAANAQFRAADFMGSGVVQAIAPAKVNLFLGVGERRSDGLHSVVTVMHALSMHDKVYVNVEPLSASDAQGVSEVIEAGSSRLAFAEGFDNLLIEIDMVDKTQGIFSGAERLAVAVQDNLAFKAAAMFAQSIEHDGFERVRIRIEKHIPAQAGLGGGSSDAAAVLICLAKLWNVEDDALLRRVAAQVGADVPFFLGGGCALFDGVGARFVRRLDASNAPLVVVKPDCGVPTAAAYHVFDERGSVPDQKLLAQAECAEAAQEVPLFNNLTNAAESLCPQIASVREWLASQEGVLSDQVLMSGSGSALFAETDSFAAASRIVAAAKREGLWARATTFSRLSAQVL